MAVDAQGLGVRVGAVQQEVIRCEVLAAGERFDADAEDAAIVDGVRVRVTGLEHGGAGAHAVESLLVVFSLVLRACFQGRRGAGGELGAV